MSGFADLGCYGSEIDTSEIDRLAALKLTEVVDSRLDRAPTHPLGLEDGGKDPASSFRRQQQRGIEHESRGDCLEVQEVETRMAFGKFRHHRDRRSRVGDADGVREEQEATDGGALVWFVEIDERARQVPTGSMDSGPTSPVVPVSRRVEFAIQVEADKDFLDQQPIIEHDPFLGGGQLLIAQVGIVNGGNTDFVPFPQHSVEFTSGRVDSARDDERRVSEINYADFATLFNSPTMTKLGGQVGLATVGNSGGRDTGHRRIVSVSS